MAASNSSSLSFFGASQDDQQMSSSQLLQQPQSSLAPPQGATPQKKRRNLPGNPIDPDAEVIALSPKTLMATNRFICEVCNKGFQREQNLQLHRRGHNLPWKLKQKSTKEVKRKVYLCPEPTCVHHDPSRALGDLTGIKKHFFRKHGEKKWKCDKCSKKYAVQSDWKAHSKTCGTREYRCDCGTLFSRRDSFITHRAFCDALAQETGRQPTELSAIGSHLYGTANQMNLSLNTQLPSPNMLQLGNATRTPKFENMNHNHLSLYGQQYPPQAGFHQEQSQHAMSSSANKQSLFHGLMQLSDHGLGNNSPTASSNMFDLGYYTGNNGTTTNNNGFNMPLLEGQMSSEDHQVINNNGNNNNINGAHGSSNFSSIYTNRTSLLQQGDNNMGLAPYMSATALLQKAAQMGSTTSVNNSSSLHRGLAPSTKSDRSHPLVSTNNSAGENLQSFSSILDSENSHLQGLMNSLTSRNTSIFNDTEDGQNGGFMSHNMFGGRIKNNVDQGHQNKHNMASNSFGKGMGRSENENKLTLDFLGVSGGVVRRNINGGFLQEGETDQGMVEFNSLDSDQLKPSDPANLPYAGGKLQ
ncbi:unnamed protein product [Rhodiola kirilowii]